MPWLHRRSSNEEPSEDFVFDDGGSGLLEACTSRFSELGWSISCDSRHAVWVTSTGASLSVGLAPWLAEHRPIDQVLDEVEARIRAAEAN